MESNIKNKEKEESIDNNNIIEIKNDKLNKEIQEDLNNLNEDYHEQENKMKEEINIDDNKNLTNNEQTTENNIKNICKNSKYGIDEDGNPKINSLYYRKKRNK